MTEKVILYGARYSVYVRIALLALLEKDVAFEHREVDVFAKSGVPADYLELHPFARIPALRHGDFGLYETNAITRYVDEAFDGPALQPEDPRERARMNQIVSIADNYLYLPLVWGIFVALDEASKSGDEPDLADAMSQSRKCLSALSDIGSFSPYLVGDRLTLADLHVVPMIAYGCTTREGRALLAEQPAMKRWWTMMQERSAVARTRFEAER